jgi:hypothetical protein
MTDHVEFNLVPQDLADAALSMRPKNWGRHERLRLVLAGMCLLLLLFVLVASYVWRRHGVFMLRWEDALAFAFAGAALGWIYGRLLARPGEDDPRLMERSFTLREDGFETTGPGFHTEIDWTSVAEIPDRGSVIFLITEWREAFFIPKRAFATPLAAGNFLKRARALHTARWDSFTIDPGEGHPAPRYEVAWRAEPADLAAFAGLKREITGWRKLLLFAPFALAGVVLALIGEEYPELGIHLDENTGTLIAILLIVGGVLYLAGQLAARILRARRLRSMPLPAGETRLVAEARGIDLVLARTRSRYAWKDIPAVTLGASHVFLATARDRAIIVPRRAFRNRPAFLSFANFAEEASKHAEA